MNTLKSIVKIWSCFVKCVMFIRVLYKRKSMIIHPQQTGMPPDLYGFHSFWSQSLDQNWTVLKSDKRFQFCARTDWPFQSDKQHNSIDKL